MTWILHRDKNGFSFTSDYAQASFLDYVKKNRTKQFTLVPKDAVSKEIRGYYHAGIIPVYAKWSEYYNHKSPEDLKHIDRLFKQEFHGEMKRDLDGEFRKYAKSTSAVSKRQFKNQFIDRIERYFETEQIPWPDPALFKQYKSSAPEISFFDWLEQHNMNCDGSPIKL